MPGPVSATLSTSAPSATRPAIVTRPPAGVWRRPFATRLASTSRIRTGSTSTIGRSSGISVVDRDRGGLGGRTEGARHVGDEQVGVGRLRVERQHARLRERDRAQVVDEPLEDARLVEDRGEVRRVCRVDTVDDRLEVAGDDRQRRPQLVADVRQQAPALLLVRLQPGGHGVEAAGELLDRREVRAGSCRSGRCSRRPRPGASRRASGRARGRLPACPGAGRRRPRRPPGRRSRPGADRGSRGAPRPR